MQNILIHLQKNGSLSGTGLCMMILFGRLFLRTCAVIINSVMIIIQVLQSILFPTLQSPHPPFFFPSVQRLTIRNVCFGGSFQKRIKLESLYQQKMYVHGLRI